MGVITHLELDFLECEVKWALGNITMNIASGSDGVPVELFQILKDDVVKVLHSILENSAVATGLEKISFHSNHKERQCQRLFKLLISRASKVMLKIPQARLQQCVNCELPNVQAGFRKGKGTRDQIPNINWDHPKSKRVPEKHLLLLY